MKSLNRITIIGNLTRDPELKQTPSGASVCSFSVATNRDWKDSTGAEKSETMYHRVIAWSKLAEIIPMFARKGSRIYVDGRMVYRQYKDKTGADRFIAEIIANDVIGLEKKPTTAAATTEDQTVDLSQFTVTPEEGGVPEPQ